MNESDYEQAYMESLGSVFPEEMTINMPMALIKPLIDEIVEQKLAQHLKEHHNL